MNIDYYLLAIASTGFIFGWITSKVTYKRKLITFIQNIRHEGRSDNEAYTAGINRGIEALKIYLLDVVTQDKVGKGHSLTLKGSRYNLSKKNNKE